MTTTVAPPPRCISSISRSGARIACVRQLRFHHDGRSRLSEFWIPTGGIAKRSQNEDSNDLLIRGGFLRQAYSGIFHMLPLGLRVQEKLERLIDKHMHSIGASKLSLSSISSQALWQKSGRLKADSEFFKFRDRKDTLFLLSPTHEEEITSLVGGLVKSYRDLPLRLYQISRKYRDEPRPRQGLLRGREFVMKDLYTFDYDIANALKSYDSVKQAYVALFEELKIPYIVAAADSGNMGGSMSHEFHIESNKGEDTVLSCTSCGHTYNEEVSDGKAYQEFTEGASSQSPSQASTGLGSQQAPAISTDVWVSISKDGATLVRAFYPKFLLADGATEPVEREVNSHAVKAIALAAGVDLDMGVKTPLEKWVAKNLPSEQKSTNEACILDIYDHRVRAFDRPPLSDLANGEDMGKISARYSSLSRCPGTDRGLDLIRVISGDRCSQCGEASMKTQNAIELAHTFHLGTRYSKVLQAQVALNPAMIEKGTASGQASSDTATVPLEMGCHGIGVSRMVSAVADALADRKGLNWPRAIAPFDLVVVPGNGLEQDAEKVYDTIRSQAPTIDATLDDRPKPLAWKLGDADLIGYPIMVVVGKAWTSEQKLEVQCRRLNGARENVALGHLPMYIESLLEKL